MYKILGLVLVFVLVLAIPPAFAEKASHMFKCEMDNEVSEDEVIAMAKEWIQAAKKVEGGENLKVNVRFPIAVNATDEMDLMFEMILPTFEEWGKFWDNYSGSEAAKMEDKHVEAGVVCPDSVVWEVEALN